MAIIRPCIDPALCCGDGLCVAVCPTHALTAAVERELDHLPLRDQEADFACINLVLHHLSDPGEGLREIRRSLPTGGHLFVADFLQHHDETMRSRYGDRWLGFDEERLQERLRQAGFEVLSCTRQAVGRGLFLLLVQARAC